MEIERKFLVNDDSYKALAYGRSEIIQAYIARGEGRTVRIRLRRELPLENGSSAASDDGQQLPARAYLTIKGPSTDGISRYEWEREIPYNEGLELFAICQPGHIRKTRWLVRSGKHVVEVDEFHDMNDGLVFAEIELATPDEPYLAPPFLGTEVTGDRRYYNGFISQHPFCTWG